MPFRAKLVDQTRQLILSDDIFAPDISRNDWDKLRTDVRAGQVHLELPCCSTRALLRTSSLGLQHFYHQPKSECHSAGETMEHLRAKLLIYRAWLARKD